MFKPFSLLFYWIWVSVTWWQETLPNRLQLLSLSWISNVYDKKVIKLFLSMKWPIFQLWRPVISQKRLALEMFCMDDEIWSFLSKLFYNFDELGWSSPGETGDGKSLHYIAISGPLSHWSKFTSITLKANCAKGQIFRISILFSLSSCGWVERPGGSNFSLHTSQFPYH